MVIQEKRKGWTHILSILSNFLAWMRGGKLIFGLSLYCGLLGLSHIRSIKVTVEPIFLKFFIDCIYNACFVFLCCMLMPSIVCWKFSTHLSFTMKHLNLYELRENRLKSLV